MKAFVTGATGFLGRRLVADLLAHDYEVTALVRTFDRARALPPGVRAVPGDVTQRATLRPGLRGADVVFHLAALHAPGARPKDYERLVRINVDGAREVLEQAAEQGVRRIVYTSAASVFGEAPGRLLDESAAPRHGAFQNEYERSKHRAHVEVAQKLQAQGLPIVIACPTAVYGPGDTSPTARLLRLYARRRLPVMLGAETANNWLYVDDAAAGHRLAAERGTPGETYLLAGPPLSLRQFFAAAERATGLPAPRLWLPAGLARVLSRALANANPGLAAALGGWAGPSRLASAEKAGRELGWQARPAADGLRATIEWLNANVADVTESANMNGTT